MSEDSQVTPEVKKSRRKTAFYPVVANTSNTKPFSKSAARRDSVLALGSIEHLQHYFTKTGISARQKPGHKGKGLVPAIGGGHLRTPSVLNGIPQLKFDLPEPPPVPQPVTQPFMNMVKDYQTDPEELLPGLVVDLEKVSILWGLGTSEQRTQDASSASPPQQDAHLLKPFPSIGITGDFDVLAVLQATTNAIRTVRNYLVALPDDDGTLGTGSSEYRPHTLSRRPLNLVKPQQRKGDSNDPLSLIRQSALKVLTALRQIEEKYRLPMTDESFEIASDNGSGSTRSRGPSPHDHTSGDDTESSASFNFSVVTVPGRKKTVPVWSDEDEDIPEEDTETEKRENWDEKLVLGGGWLYRQDVSLTQVEKERDEVANYLDTVDSVLFSGESTEGVRGWSKVLGKLKSMRRRSSSRDGRATPDPGSLPSRQTGLLLQTMQTLSLSDVVPEEPSSPVDEEHLPGWAKRTEFIDDPLGRAYALLVTLLPVELLHLLPSPSQPLTSTGLMTSLSSGQLLCVAYNVGVRKSKKPWGYINKTAIWDIAALEAEADNVQEGEGEKEKRRSAWTFRRTENLRLWAAALKLRYMIPLISISQITGAPSRLATPSSSPGPSTVAFNNGIVPNLFDAATIAKRHQYWEEMLHDAVLLWMQAVVGEKREEQ